MEKMFFENLYIIEPILRAIKNEGYMTPTPYKNGQLYRNCTRKKFPKHKIMELTNKNNGIVIS
jgi:hypothetical protein